MLVIKWETSERQGRAKMGRTGRRVGGVGGDMWKPLLSHGGNVPIKFSGGPNISCLGHQ